MEIDFDKEITTILEQHYSHSFLLNDIEQRITNIINHSPNHNNNHMNSVLDSLTHDLEVLCLTFEKNIEELPVQTIIKNRIHQLSINKILVFTYGKSDFRLISSHYNLARAYMFNQSFQQAINHVTIASTKIAKFSDIKETKIYHSYILLLLGQCYFSIGRFDYSLEALSRAYEIQFSNQNKKNNYLIQNTLQLLSKCYLKLKSTELSTKTDEMVKSKLQQEAKMRNKEESLRFIQKLIDLLSNQFNEFESIYKKLNVLLNTSMNQRSKKPYDQEQVVQQFLVEKTAKNSKKKGEFNDIYKLCDEIQECVEYIIIDYNKKGIRALLANKKRIDPASAYEHLSNLIQEIASILQIISKHLIRHKLFKFKAILINSTFTNIIIEQQLKEFQKQFQNNKFKYFSELEYLEIYKLFLLFYEKNCNLDIQYTYLKKIEEIYELTASDNQKIELIKIKKQLGLYFKQRQYFQKQSKVLEEIQVLQQEVEQQKVKRQRSNKQQVSKGKNYSKYVLQKRNSLHDTRKKDYKIINKLKNKKTVFLDIENAFDDDQNNI